MLWDWYLKEIDMLWDWYVKEIDMVWDWYVKEIDMLWDWYVKEIDMLWNWYVSGEKKLLAWGVTTVPGDSHSLTSKPSYSWETILLKIILAQTRWYIHIKTDANWPPSWRSYWSLRPGRDRPPVEIGQIWKRSSACRDRRSGQIR